MFGTRRRGQGKIPVQIKLSAASTVFIAFNYEKLLIVIISLKATFTSHGWMCHAANLSLF